MNLDIYTTEMSKSIWDKSFFMDKIPGVKCIVDFGCADGAMIRYLSPLFPDIVFVGYDISEELIDRARQTIPYQANTVFFHNHKFAINFVRDKYKPDEICINFSSVLHEIFSSSVCGKIAIKQFIDELKPKFVTVRDMYFHQGDEINNTYVQGPNTDLEIHTYAKDFELVYGSIKSSFKNLLHFLMKYQWKDNGWDVEMNENYFSWTIPDLKALIGTNYKTTFEAHYQLPYLTELWSHMFYNPNLHTHIQLILRREE